MCFIRGFPLKEMDKQAAVTFWEFFEHEQKHFVEVLTGHDSAKRRALVDEIDRMLCPVFPYAKPECIGFQLECCSGMNKLVLFHSGQIHLAEDMYRLCEMMPESLWKIWTVSLRG